MRIEKSIVGVCDCCRGCFFFNWCFHLPVGRYSFCSCRKVTERARSRPTVLSIPLCRRIVSTTHIKDYFNPYYYPRSRTLFIAYGNISNVILSEITLHVCFSIFVCTARSQTKFCLNVQFTCCSLEYRRH